MTIEDILTRIQEIREVATSQKEARELIKIFIKNFNNEFEIIEK